MTVYLVGPPARPPQRRNTDRPDQSSDLQREAEELRRQARALRWQNWILRWQLLCFEGSIWGRRIQIFAMTGDLRFLDPRVGHQDL